MEMIDWAGFLLSMYKKGSIMKVCLYDHKK